MVMTTRRRTSPIAKAANARAAGAPLVLDIPPRSDQVMAVLGALSPMIGWPQEPVGPHVMACLTRADTARDVPEWIHTIILNPED